MKTQSERHVLARNFPWCEEYDDKSFLGILHEEQRWDAEEYWLLEWALLSLKEQNIFERETQWRAFRIFSHTMLSIGCHFDSNDGYVVRGLSDDELCDWRDRFQLAFEAFFGGRWPGDDSFETTNPIRAEHAS